jgi:hypothetical protein
LPWAGRDRMEEVLQGRGRALRSLDSEDPIRTSPTARHASASGGHVPLSQTHDPIRSAKIGHRFGARDHTVVLHAIRKIDGEVAQNSSVRQEIA